MISNAIQLNYAKFKIALLIHWIDLKVNVRLLISLPKCSHLPLIWCSLIDTIKTIPSFVPFRKITREIIESDQRQQ